MKGTEGLRTYSTVEGTIREFKRQEAEAREFIRNTPPRSRRPALVESMINYADLDKSLERAMKEEYGFSEEQIVFMMEYVRTNFHVWEDRAVGLKRLADFVTKFPSK